MFCFLNETYFTSWMFFNLKYFSGKLSFPCWIFFNIFLTFRKNVFRIYNYFPFEIFFLECLTLWNIILFKMIFIWNVSPYLKCFIIWFFNFWNVYLHGMFLHGFFSKMCLIFDMFFIRNGFKNGLLSERRQIRDTSKK